MIAKKLATKHVDSREYENYLNTAEKFFTGAETEIGTENFPAAGVLIIHAAIAYTDAITVKFGSAKHSGEHELAGELVRQFLELSGEDEEALNRFNRLIAEKTKVSYTGTTFSAKKIGEMQKNLTRYREWVRKKLR